MALPPDDRRLAAYLVGSDLSAGTAPVQAASDFQNLHEVSQGREHPILFLPFEDFADSWLVRPEAINMPRSHRQDGSQVFPLAVREVAFAKLRGDQKKAEQGEKIMSGE